VVGNECGRSACDTDETEMRDGREVRFPETEVEGLYSAPCISLVLAHKGSVACAKTIAQSLSGVARRNRAFWKCGLRPMEAWMKQNFVPGRFRW
jgi:hypothetical protein